MIDRPRFWSSEKCSGLKLIISSARLSGVLLDSRVVWHSVKCIQNRVPSVTELQRTSSVRFFKDSKCDARKLHCLTSSNECTSEAAI